MTANPPVHGVTVPLKEMSALWGIRFIYNHLLQRSRINKCLVLTSDIVGNYHGKTKDLKTKMAKYTLFFIRTHFIKTLRLRLPKNYEQFKNNDQAGCKDPKKLQRREIDQINWNLMGNWYTNEQWMNGMHKLRRNFTINKVYAIKIFSCNIVGGSVSKQNVIFTNLRLKYTFFPSNQPFSNARSKIIIVTRTK